MKNNKHVESFGEFNEIRSSKINESDETEKTDVRVKDLISFLQKFDPEMPVYLDKDGWPNAAQTQDVACTPVKEIEIGSGVGGGG